MTRSVCFTELLTAADPDLVRMFYKVKSDPKEDFILRINRIKISTEERDALENSI